MRHLHPVLICLMIMGIGCLAAFDKIQQPVGGVSELFCKRPEKPCTTFEYEVNK